MELYENVYGEDFSTDYEDVLAQVQKLDKQLRKMKKKKKAQSMVRSGN